MYLKDKYLKEIVPALQKDLGLENIMEVPKVEKVVLNIGIGSYLRSGNKDFSSLKDALALIAGQNPVVRNARKSISNFKLREGMPVGLTVTLRGENMYAFLEKIITIVLPRVRDFRGVNKRSFDAEGNYNFGIKEHTIFPEVPQDDVVKPYGIQVTLKTSTNNKAAGEKLLNMMGFPFSK